MVAARACVGQFLVRQKSIAKTVAENGKARSGRSPYRSSIYMDAQASAHFLQAAAHDLQQSWADNFPHSAAQALQISAHSLQRALVNAEPLASNLAHRAQMSAQSRQSAMHVKCSLSFMPMQWVAQLSHATAHARHASIHLLLKSFILDCVGYEQDHSQRKSESISKNECYTIIYLLCKIHGAGVHGSGPMGLGRAYGERMSLP